MKRQAVSMLYRYTRRDPPASMIRIRARAGNSRQGWLTGAGLAIPVALGRGGIRANKREGDGATPRGAFFPRKLWWRADRFRRPRTFLATCAITPADAWCEDPDDRHYNGVYASFRSRKHSFLESCLLRDQRGAWEGDAFWRQ